MEKMKKHLFSFVIVLLVIVISISYMGTLTQDSVNSSFSILIQSNIRLANETNASESTIRSSSTREEVSFTTKPVQNNKPAIRYNFLKRYPHMTECSLNSDLVKKYNPDVAEFSINYSAPAANSTHSLRILRAVLVYFPIEKHAEFELEFRWLYRSWIEMLHHEPTKWRTDLIAFVEHDSSFFNNSQFFLNQMNCSFNNKRTSPLQPPMCTLIKYVPLKKRALNRTPIVFGNRQIYLRTNKERYQFVLNSVNIFDENEANLLPFYRLLKDKLSSYGYLDSILMAFDGYSYLKSAGYNFLIRSDMDVFLTPLFAKWIPAHCNDFYVGRGGYSTVFNVKRLARVAKILGMEFAGEMNLGSTWYSTVDQFRLISYLTLFGMSYLAEEEFTQPEREGKVGVILWPEWHYGVVLLYGQNLIMNHLIKTKQVNIVKLEEHLDYPAYYAENVNRILHIHVFHGDEMFSKFQFKAGAYDNFNYENNNCELAKFYALKMALEGKKMQPSLLNVLMRNQTSNKN